MPKIILENVGIIIAVILVLLLLNVFNKGIVAVDTVVSENEHITSYDVVNNLGLERSEVKGSDVVGFIRYYKSDATVTINVTNTNGSESFITNDYNSGLYEIIYTDLYDVSVTYGSSNEVVSVTCTLK